MQYEVLHNVTLCEL